MPAIPLQFPIGPGSAGDEQSLHLGRIVKINDDGHPIVQFAGAPGGQVAARVATLDSGPGVGESWRDVPVLLMLEDGDPARPIIIGFVRDKLAQPRPREAEIRSDISKSFEINGKTLIFEGKEEIVLRCGSGSLTIRADGQIVVKGTRLTSRASQTNKIRGATVLIN